MESSGFSRPNSVITVKRQAITALMVMFKGAAACRRISPTDVSESSLTGADVQLKSDFRGIFRQTFSIVFAFSQEFCVVRKARQVNGLETVNNSPEKRLI